MKKYFVSSFAVVSIFALQEAIAAEKPVAVIFRGASTVAHAEYALSYQAEGKKTLELSFGLVGGPDFSPITDSANVPFITLVVTAKGSAVCYTVDLKNAKAIATFTGVKAGSKVDVYNGFGPIGTNRKEPPLVSFIAGKQPAGSRAVDPTALAAKTYPEVRSTLVSDPGKDLAFKLYQQRKLVGFTTYDRLQMQQ
jgi:hypothetical protein